MLLILVMIFGWFIKKNKKGAKVLAVMDLLAVLVVSKQCCVINVTLGRMKKAIKKWTIK